MMRQQKISSKPAIVFDGEQSLRQPLSIRLLNRLGRLLEKTGWSLANRPQDALIAAAERWAGASEWGHDIFREGFHVLLESFRKDAKLHYTGWQGIHYLLVSHLSNHFGIQRQLKHHPEILTEDIRRPLIITGLPRSGTTLLHNLMCTDPAHRWLTYWEAVRPVPPPTKVSRDTDPRVTEATRILQSIARKRPDMNSAHAMNPHYPEECVVLLYNTFMTPGFSLFAWLEDYPKWLAKQDMTFAYRNYRQQLQLLQHQHHGKRWVLKSPVHLLALDALLTVFPDACIVQIHRDPLKAIPSRESYVGKWRSIFSDQVIYGESNRSSFRLNNLMERCLRVRDAVDGDIFHDVQYIDLVTDPIKAVRQIYARFGFTFDAVFEANMCAWLSKNPKDKHGEHRYCLEQFGLEGGMIVKDFADYTARFEILPE